MWKYQLAPAQDIQVNFSPTTVLLYSSALIIFVFITTKGHITDKSKEVALVFCASFLVMVKKYWGLLQNSDPYSTSQDVSTGSEDTWSPQFIDGK